MNRGIEVLLVASLLMLSGCGTINTVFRPDTVTSQGLKDSRSHCGSVPRIYSGVISGFCYLNSEPKPEKGVDNPGFGQPASNIFPIIAIEALASRTKACSTFALKRPWGRRMSCWIVPIIWRPVLP